MARGMHDTSLCWFILKLSWFESGVTCITVTLLMLHHIWARSLTLIYTTTSGLFHTYLYDYTNVSLWLQWYIYVFLISYICGDVGTTFLPSESHLFTMSHISFLCIVFLNWGSYIFTVSYTSLLLIVFHFQVSCLIVVGHITSLWAVSHHGGLYIITVVLCWLAKSISMHIWWWIKFSLLWVAFLQFGSWI